MEFSNTRDKTKTQIDKLSCIKSVDPLSLSLCDKQDKSQEFFIVPGNTTLGITVWWILDSNRDRCLTTSGVNKTEVKIAPRVDGRCTTDWIIHYTSLYGWYSALSAFPQSNNLCMAVNWTSQASAGAITLQDCTWNNPDEEKAKNGRLEQLFSITWKNNGVPFGADYT